MAVNGERVALQDWVAELSVEASADRPADVLDLALVIDTTGSMCDELAWLQSELRDVVGRVRVRFEGAVRVSVTVYRDVGDAYVVRAGHRHGWHLRLPDRRQRHRRSSPRTDRRPLRG